MLITSKDIIQKYLRFKQLVPNINNWNEEKLKNNSYLLNLFFQLRAIFCAFNLGLLRDFEKGSFVRNFPIEAFNKLIKIAKDNGCFDHYECSSNVELDYKCLELLFMDLWDWRMRIDEILHLNSEFKNIGGVNLYAYQEISKVNKIIADNLGTVEQLLGYIITPLQESISEEILSEKYAYPIIENEYIEQS